MVAHQDRPSPFEYVGSARAMSSAIVAMSAGSSHPRRCRKPAFRRNVAISSGSSSGANDRPRSTSKVTAPGSCTGTPSTSARHTQSHAMKSPSGPSMRDVRTRPERDHGAQLLGEVGELRRVDAEHDGAAGDALDRDEGAVPLDQRALVPVDVERERRESEMPHPSSGEVPVQGREAGVEPLRRVELLDRGVRAGAVVDALHAGPLRCRSRDGTTRLLQSARTLLHGGGYETGWSSRRSAIRRAILPMRSM